MVAAKCPYTSPNTRSCETKGPSPSSDPVAKAARPASRPEGAAPLVPVQEPFTAPVTRSDLPGRYTPPDPAEGIWRLRDRVIAGQPVRPGRGYLVIGRRHLLAQFVDIHGAAKTKSVPANCLMDVVEKGAGFAGFAVSGLGMQPHDP